LQLTDTGIEIHCLRDLTRGGLASALNEIATAAGVTITVEEDKIPVQEAVQGACEILGFDPLYVANEGRFIAFVPEGVVKKALKMMGPGAHVIGTVQESSSGLVKLRSRIGAERILDMLSGEQLPRIC
jgi:hydrogenase expression/formation protein HypE